MHLCLVLVISWLLCQVASYDLEALMPKQVNGRISHNEHINSIPNYFGNDYISGIDFDEKQPVDENNNSLLRKRDKWTNSGEQTFLRSGKRNVPWFTKSTEKTFTRSGRSHSNVNKYRKRDNVWLTKSGEHSFLRSGKRSVSWFTDSNEKPFGRSGRMNLFRGKGQHDSLKYRKRDITWLTNSGEHSFLRSGKRNLPQFAKSDQDVNNKDGILLKKNPRNIVDSPYNLGSEIIQFIKRKFENIPKEVTLHWSDVNNDPYISKKDDYGFTNSGENKFLMTGKRSAKKKRMTDYVNKTKVNDYQKEDFFNYVEENRLSKRDLPWYTDSEEEREYHRSG